MTACLITFPLTTALTEKCPRCGEDAGSHPVSSLLLDTELSVKVRPTYREALASYENRYEYSNGDVDITVPGSYPALGEVATYSDGKSETVVRINH